MASPRPEDRRYTDIRLVPDAAAWAAEELPARRAEPLAAVAATAPGKDWEAIVRGVTLLARLLATGEHPKSDRS